MRILAWALCALMPAFAQAAPEIVGVRTGYANSNSGLTFTLPAFEVPAFSGQSQIVIGICHENGGTAMTMGSVAWNGHSGSQVAISSAVTNDRNTAFFWEIPDVDPGTADLTVTMTFQFHVTVVAAVLHNVGPPEATATGNAVSGTTLSVPITTTSSASLVLSQACGSFTSIGLTPTAMGQTSVGGITSPTQADAAAQQVGPMVAGSTTTSWSFANLGAVGGANNQRVAALAVSFPDTTPVTCAGCDYVPPDTLMINMLSNPYAQCQGVVGDGVHDDGPAISACMTYWGPTGIFTQNTDQKETLFFPPGTYRLTNTVRANGEEDRLSFLCAPGAKFVLDDNATGYADACMPKPLFYAGNPNNGNATAFENNFIGCEIDTGNNPGANALDWIGNNVVAVRDNYIHGAAFNTGISLERKITGPMIVANNHVVGGRYGSKVLGKYYNTVYDGNRFEQQSIEGLLVSEHGAQVLNHESVQTNGHPAVHALQGFWMTHLNVLGGVFTNTGGASAPAVAIDDGGGTQARAFARNITSTGYAWALKRGTDMISGPLSEFVSHAVNKAPGLAAGPNTTLNLPIPSHPHRVHPNAADWVNLCTVAVPCDGVADNTARLQSLVNAGGPKVVYCSGRVLLTQIDIPPTSNLERIIGFDCSLNPTATAASPWFTSRSTKGVEFDRVTIKSSAPSAPRVLHNGTGPLIVTDVTQAFPYACTAGSGPLYVSNASILNITTCGNDFVGRQVNLEAVPGVAVPKLLVDGGTAVVVGLKTENRGQSRTHVRCQNGAQCEIFGGFHLGASDLAAATEPMYECNESDCNFSYATTVDNPTNGIQIRTVRSGTTADLPAASLAARGQGRATALFVERP